jgi:hypothetical protein
MGNYLLVNTAPSPVPIHWNQGLRGKFENIHGVKSLTGNQLDLKKLADNCLVPVPRPTSDVKRWSRTRQMPVPALDSGFGKARNWVPHHYDVS